MALHNNYSGIWFGNTTLTASNTSTSAYVTITTHGRPVLVGCTGDLNPKVAESTWISIYLYRDVSTLLKGQVCQSNTSSTNVPFSNIYLDGVAAGIYTYHAVINRSNGTCQLNEGGNSNILFLFAFEI